MRPALEKRQGTKSRVGRGGGAEGTMGSTIACPSVPCSRTQQTILSNQRHVDQQQECETSNLSHLSAPAQFAASRPLYARGGADKFGFGGFLNFF
jgi:hypothetical protein